MAPALAKRIRSCLSGTYYEPFIGSGAVLFALSPERAVVADALPALTATYNAVKRNPISIWNFLKSISEDSKETYYQYRSRFNALLSHAKYDDDEFAALFIYLNRAGYNGLWRQNQEGEYNVPYGDHPHLKLPSFAELLEIGKLLQNVEVVNVSSSDETLAVIRRADSGDVVYADPPYLETFQGYDGIIASTKDFHEKLAIELWQAARRGVAVFATNNDCPDVRKWYGAFAEIETYKRAQSIAGTEEGRKQWNQILAIAVP